MSGSVVLEYGIMLQYKMIHSTFDLYLTYELRASKTFFHQYNHMDLILHEPQFVLVLLQCPLLNHLLKRFAEPLASSRQQPRLLAQFRDLEQSV